MEKPFDRRGKCDFLQEIKEEKIFSFFIGDSRVILPKTWASV